MEISIDPVECLTVILTLVALAVIAVTINALLRLGNRLIRGPERVEAIVLVIHPDTIYKYAPQSITTAPDGKSIFNFQILLSKLFKHAISDKVAKRWAKSGKMSLLLLAELMETSSEIATRMAITELDRNYFPLEILTKSKVYSISSSGTEKRLTAHLVIIGNIPKPPPQITWGED